MENRLSGAGRKHTTENSNAPTVDGNNSKGEDIPSTMTPSSNDDERNESAPTPGRLSKQEPEEDVDKSKPWWKKVWSKLALDPPTLLMMFKGSVAPTIGIAFYQSRNVSNVYGTIGYLVPIITVISLPILPRAKYLQSMILNVFAVCIGAAMALLGIWTGLKARENTSSPGSIQPYNSSQSTVCAIWLFANIYFVNTARAKMPALQVPVIMYSIFTNVAFVYGHLFTGIAQVESFVRMLLISFLTAFGLATAVNLFIIPVTSRKVVFKEFAGYFQAIRGTLKAQTAYLASLEHSDMFAEFVADDASTKKDGKKRKSKKADDDSTNPRRMQSPQAKKLKGAIEGLKGLHGKLYGDLPFGKREVAWGKLNADHLDEIFVLFRKILIPLVGLGTIIDIFERIAEKRGWVNDHNHQQSEENEKLRLTKEKEKRIWNEMMKCLHEPFAVVMAAMDEGLEHAALLLEVESAPRKEVDIEANGTNPKPGDLKFSEQLKERLSDFYKSRGVALKVWAKERGLSRDHFDNMNEAPADGQSTKGADEHREDQQQLYLVLYMEFLLYSVGAAIFEMMEYGEKKVEEGTMKKNQVILPGQHRIRKWITSIGREDSGLDGDAPDSLESGSANVYMGAGFGPKKDPEHLPPSTAWQHFGNGLRKIPKFLGSTESSFGFRVACATLTIGIVAFLKNSQQFFIEQRLVWAMIIIAIGMNVTSGSSMFGFFGRVFGTFLSMIFSFIIWYIVNQKTAGVIVFLWLFIFIEMYGFLKYPRFIPIWLICIVTQVLIIGYELEVRKLGVQAATSNGQPYYPIYQLAPYRLACVAGGSFVAFFWTIFPYPISDRSWLRKDLGATLFLLADYQSAVHSTIYSRMHGTEGDMELKTSPGRRLEKIRYKIFGKLLLLLPSLQQHAEWEKWEITVGGKFPRKSYEEIIYRTTNIMSYLSLVGYATQSWSTKTDYPSTFPINPTTRTAWLHDLTLLLDRLSPTSHSVTSTLILLSHSVTQGSPLPPYFNAPKGFDLSKSLEALDSGILDARHVEEPGYSAYAVCQVANSLINDDLQRLCEAVRELVGETDFSWKVEGSEESLKGKRD